MNNPLIMIGLGEMGGVFARGFLKIGCPVVPATRAMDLNQLAAEIPAPRSVVVAVGEKDLHSILKSLPTSWRDRLVLLQNELLPRDWQAYPLKNPTVISVWFEKKAGQDFKVLIPSPVFGPQANLVHEALSTLKIPCRVLKNEEELLLELVLKNLYILTVNIAGLVIGGTVSELWSQHQQLARDVVDNVLDIQEWLTGKKFNRQQLLVEMLKVFEGDPQHKCMGRTAFARLERAVTQADEAQLPVKKLREILSQQNLSNKK